MQKPFRGAAGRRPETRTRTKAQNSGPPAVSSTLREIEERQASPLLKNLADHLIIACDKSGLKKSDFAEEVLGISYTEFRMLKRRVANPPLRTIEKIADALKISLVDLLSPPPPKKRRRAQSSYHDHIDAIGEVLLEHWQKSGMPKRTFAVSIGLSVPQFYKIMGGTASFLILGLAGLAERLNISLAELLGEEAS